MGTTAKDAGGDFELTPAGTHLAICYMVADLGYQETSFGVKPKIVIGWELPAELMTDGRPFAASQIYTLSLSEKANLRKDLEAWRGRPFTEAELDGFDVQNVLGKACTLTIVHNKNGDKTYANIANVAGVMKGMQIPERANDLLYFNLDEPNKNIFGKLPKWVQKKIEAAQDAPIPAAETASDLPFDDDIPF